MKNEKPSNRDDYWVRGTELEGFEPSNAGVKVLCLTAWRQPNLNRGYAIRF